MLFFFFFSSSNEYAVSLLPLWICDQPLCHELGGPAVALPPLQRESHCCVKRLCASVAMKCGASLSPGFK